MDQLRKILTSIGTNLGKLSFERKLLVGAVAVILVMVLFMVAQRASVPAASELLPGVAPADQQRAAAALDGLGIAYTLKSGRVYVQPADGPRARAALAEAGQLPGDKNLLFENLIASQRWTNSRQLNEQNYVIALQNELARTISEFKGVRGSRVLLDIPERQGIAERVRLPSASVSVMTDDGRAITQSMADAIAAFVGGSRAGLSADQIRIVDSTGRQWRATTDENALPTTYLDHAARVEETTRRKVSDLLGYIRGVVVAVTAQVDVTRSTAQIETNLPEKQGTVSVMKSRTETVKAVSESQPGAGAPGVEANQTADITRGPAGAGNRQDTSETREEFQVSVGTKRETIVDPKGHPTVVAVSVGVPRSFVAGLMKAGQAADAAATEPAEQDVRARFDQDVKPAIIATLLPHVRAMTAQANSGVSAEELTKMLQDSISVAMIPADVPAFEGTQAAGLLGSLGGGGDGVLGLPGNLVETGLLALLGVVALTMMLMMVKKAGKKTEMPTAEELVGLPPALETATDLIGEADEGETAMAGIEVDEGQMQNQKILEQVGEMVTKDPGSAARLLNRWIEVEQ